MIGFRVPVNFLYYEVGMKPNIGLYIRDANLNLYHIIGERGVNGHSGKTLDYQVECTKGPNIGKIRWIGSGTIVNGDFPVTRD
jgi:hypothetical protein